MLELLGSASSLIEQLSAIFRRIAMVVVCLMVTVVTYEVVATYIHAELVDYGCDGEWRYVKGKQ